MHLLTCVLLSLASLYSSLQSYELLYSSLQCTALFLDCQCVEYVQYNVRLVCSPRLYRTVRLSSRNVDTCILRRDEARRDEMSCSLPFSFSFGDVDVWWRGRAGRGADSNSLSQLRHDEHSVVLLETRAIHFYCVCVAFLTPFSSGLALPRQSLRRRMLVVYFRSN